MIIGPMWFFRSVFLCMTVCVCVKGFVCLFVYFLFFGEEVGFFLYHSTLELKMKSTKFTLNFRKRAEVEKLQKKEGEIKRSRNIEGFLNDAGI